MCSCIEIFVIEKDCSFSKIKNKDDIMITEKDKDAISQLARQYGVDKVFLFGSSVESQKVAGDIDLGVLGIEPRRFFEFYGELMFRLSKPIDLIDLSKDTKFNAIIKREGIPIYG